MKTKVLPLIIVLVLLLIFVAWLLILRIDNHNIHTPQYEQLRREICDIKAQNQFLSKRIEINNAEMLLLKGAVGSDDVFENLVIKNMEFDSPTELLDAYFTASTWQERLSLVLNPEKVYKQMYKYYSGGLFEKGYEQVSSYTVHSIDESILETSKEFWVEVDLNGSPFTPYLVVHSDTGYKIDWLKSRFAWKDTKDSRLRRKYGNEYSVDVKILRVKQFPASLKIEIEMQNVSSVIIQDWSMELSVLSSNGVVVAKDSIYGDALSPRKSKLYIYEIADWIPRYDSFDLSLSLSKITDVEGHEIPDIASFFSLHLTDDVDPSMLDLSSLILEVKAKRYRIRDNNTVELLLACLNRSKYFIDSACVQVVAFNARNDIQAKNDVYFNNLGAGKQDIGTATFYDVTPVDIDSWEFRLDSVRVIDNNNEKYDMHRFFKIDQLNNSIDEIERRIGK